MNTRLNQISLLIKPASGLCNLRCQYCFYYDVVDHRASGQHGMMSLDTLEQLVKRAYEYPRQHVSFMFQGGEPTLVGLAFYKRFIELVDKYNPNHVPTSYSIQTNGLLIDSAFARFLKQHSFLVGISIDGNQRVHDTYRLDGNGNGSFQAVKKGLRHLQQQQVDYNILSVVTDETVTHTEEVYRYLSSQGTDYLQFIPCIDPFEDKSDNHTLTVDQYEVFLKRLFDVWYNDFKKGRRISIRYFDDIVKMVAGYPPASCQQFGYCALHQVVEANGDLYPCDFYVIDEWRLGNIYEDSLDTLIASTKAKEFVQTSYGLHEDCKTCRFVSLCRGGCRRNKEPFVQVDYAKTRYCSAYNNFFEYSIDRFVQITKTILSEQQ